MIIFFTGFNLNCEVKSYLTSTNMNIIQIVPRVAFLSMGVVISYYSSDIRTIDCTVWFNSPGKCIEARLL